MKNFLLGIITLIVFQTVIGYAERYAFDNEKKILGDVSYHTLQALQGAPVIDVLTSRCTNASMGYTTRRDYFECSAIQIFISDLIFR